MADMDLRDIFLTLTVVVFSVIILYMALRIILKARRDSDVKRTKKARVLKALPSTPDSDSVFNTIVSTKRIASDLKRRGIDTGEADTKIKKAESEYTQGRERNARFIIEEAKELLINSKSEWDEKTGFDVVPSSPTSESQKTYKEAVDLSSGGNLGSSESLKPEEEFPELSKAAEKKPDNYLPSKFTISLANKAIEDAGNAGFNAQEAQRLLLEAKGYFDREDYDQAFKLALSSKKEAEALLGVVPTDGKAKRKAISDLAITTQDAEDLKICSICGGRKVAYICIEINGGEEATCQECYEKSVRGMIETKEVPEAQPPPPPPPPIEVAKEVSKEREIKEEREAQKEEKIEEEEPNFCPNCGAKAKAEDVFCGKCGKPVKEELKCVGCGTTVEPGDVFCRKCGARLVT